MYLPKEFRFAGLFREYEISVVIQHRKQGEEHDKRRNEAESDRGD